MRGVYTAQLKITGITTAKTLLYMDNPATCAIEILSAKITNSSNETNEQLEACVAHVNSKGTPADASTVLVAKHEVGDAASLLVDGTNLLGNLTTEPTSYFEAIGHKGFPSLSGWRFEPPPEERPAVAPSKAFGLRLLTAPTSFDCIAEITWREIA